MMTVPLTRSQRSQPLAAKEVSKICWRYSRTIVGIKGSHDVTGKTCRALARRRNRIAPAHRVRRNTALHVPPGRAVKDYRLVGEKGEVRFAELFGHKDTFVVYIYIYGPKRERPCPMYTSLLSRMARRRT